MSNASDTTPAPRTPDPDTRTPDPGNRTRLTSESNPRIKCVVRLRKSAGAEGRRASGLFLCEGAREVARAVAAGVELEEVFVLADAEAGSDVAEAAAAAEAAGARGYDVTDKVLRKMAYHREPEGVLAVARRPATEVDRLPAARPGGVWLVAVGTAKPGNLGAMVRTADALGCDAVLAAGAPVDPFHPNAIRASTGAVFSMPVAVCEPQLAIACLRERGVRLLALTVDGDQLLPAAVEQLDRDRWPPIAAVIGPEDTGLDGDWVRAAKDSGGGAVRIDTAGRVADSLNASVAAAIALHELTRGRRKADRRL